MMSHATTTSKRQVSVTVDQEFLEKLKDFQRCLNQGLDKILVEDESGKLSSLSSLEQKKKQTAEKHTQVSNEEGDSATTNFVEQSKSRAVAGMQVHKGALSTINEEIKQNAQQLPHKWACSLKQILFSEQKIEARLKEMGAKISHDYAGKEILAVGLLTGCIMFQINLLKYLTVPYQIDFIQVSSYGSGTSSSGNVKLKKDLSKDPKGKHILITEDLIDTGKTLSFISKYFSDKKCSSIKIACLLSKSARRDTGCHVNIDYCGFDCPDEFVVGYGMDFAGHYRCMPFVGVLKPEAFAHLSK
eukprot:CAMPEP_0197519724 /NCGR_PEP_ID=MMETSP1318-20131121/4994_1 /TAXON_ID=552666 /ORGANISM="Partenskyella glossopodia, Strain RCC365" /LENGTH=300 /DNA_ID=CAMNT_0043070873 /DNA_START=135 /DNA_END=1037 /DNA_ORIENTATION=+